MAISKRRIEIQIQIGNKRMERTNLENKIRAKVTEENNKARAEIREIDYKIQDITNGINRAKSKIGRASCRERVYVLV